MEKVIEDNYINDAILYILYALKIKPSDFIKIYKKNESDIHKTIRQFENYCRQFNNIKIKNNFNKFKDLNEAELIKNKLEKTGAYILNIGNKYYPRLLKEIHFPPPVLFFKGPKIMQDNNYIAVVGTRKNTAYGKDVATYISAELSKSGITVVSGMAAGIDYWAHKAALKHKGGTLGVLGCGINIIYPPENAGLFNEMMDNGSIMTEFICDTAPLRHNFPARNRLISGISMGVVVIEAPQKSGALITADFALEHDREVFAVPGSIFSDESLGCHNLVKNGAKLVSNVDDVLCEITQFYNKKTSLYKQEPLFADCNKQHTDKSSRIPGNRGIEENIMFADPDKKSVYEIIGYRPKSIEEIQLLSGLKTSKVMQVISELELENLVCQKNLNQFIRM